MTFLDHFYSIIQFFNWNSNFWQSGWPKNWIGIHFWAFSRKKMPFSGCPPTKNDGFYPIWCRFSREKGSQKSISRAAFRDPPPTKFGGRKPVFDPLFSRNPTSILIKTLNFSGGHPKKSIPIVNFWPFWGSKNWIGIDFWAFLASKWPFQGVPRPKIGVS